MCEVTTRSNPSDKIVSPAEIAAGSDRSDTEPDCNNDILSSSYDFPQTNLSLSHSVPLSSSLPASPSQDDVESTPCSDENSEALCKDQLGDPSLNDL